VLQSIPLEHEGASLEARAAVPDWDAPFPTVLVMHSALGREHQVKKTVRRLAELGYAGIATDMYGGAIDHRDENATGQAFMALHENPELLRARTVAWLEAATALPFVDRNRIAAIGYCFGGQCVLELARSGADVKAVVSYHGLLTTARPATPGTIRGEVVAYCGARDPYAPMEDIEALRTEMTAAGASFQITIFGDAAHAFTDPDAAVIGRPGIEYHALSNQLSWAGTLALLEGVLRT